MHQYLYRIKAQGPAYITKNYGLNLLPVAIGLSSHLVHVSMQLAGLQANSFYYSCKLHL